MVEGRALLWFRQSWASWRLLDEVVEKQGWKNTGSKEGTLLGDAFISFQQVLFFLGWCCLLRSQGFRVGVTDLACIHSS